MCERCDELEEEVAWLKSELGLQRHADVFERLRDAMHALGRRTGRAQAAELIAALHAAGGRPMTRWQIMDAIPSPTGKDRDSKIVDVWVHFARRSLPEGAISNVYGRGYRLTDIGMAFVRDVLEPQQAAA